MKKKRCYRYQRWDGIETNWDLIKIAKEATEQERESAMSFPIHHLFPHSQWFMCTIAVLLPYYSYRGYTYTLILLSTIKDRGCSHIHCKWAQNFLWDSIAC